MLITGIKSRPVYDRLKPFAQGTYHIVAGQGGGGAAMLRLLGEMDDAMLQRTLVLYSRESFSGHYFDEELSQLRVHSRELFTRNHDLVERLSAVLVGCKMGTRLYLAGSESFIGTAMQVAARFNLNRDEVLREHNGTLVRRVWCVHCDTYTENVTKRVYRCPGCGLDLIVRDHYSSRFAAFMAVKFDAEQCGLMPPNEELDT